MEEAKLSNSIALGTLLSRVIFLAQPRPHKHIPSEKEAERSILMTEGTGLWYLFLDVILHNGLYSLHCSTL